jgi:hypothetical protein
MSSAKTHKLDTIFFYILKVGKSPVDCLTLSLGQCCRLRAIVTLNRRIALLSLCVLSEFTCLSNNQANAERDNDIIHSFSRHGSPPFFV